MPVLSRSSRPKREKLFGAGRPRPLDRNQEIRIMVLARGVAAHGSGPLLWRDHRQNPRCAASAVGLPQRPDNLITFVSSPHGGYEN
jgi:hypothetical protein